MDMAIEGITAARRDAITTFERARWVVPAIFALAIGLRLALMWVMPQQPMSDGLWYMDRAHEMARGMDFQEQGRPTAFWPVGYPAALAASMVVTGPSLFGPMLLNLIAAAAILALIFRFGTLLGMNPLGVRIAGLLYALYPAHIAYTGQTFSETVSTALLMAAFATMIAGRARFWALVGAGLLFGAATLMRAQVMYFPIGALVAMALCLSDFGWRGFARALLPVHLAIAAVVLPWSIRNTVEMGAFIPVSTNGGIALFTGNNPRATGDWYEWERTDGWDKTGVGIPFREHVYRQVELDRRFKAMAKDWIVHHPGEWFALGFKKIFYLWRKDSDGLWGVDSSYPNLGIAFTLAQAANQLYYMGVLMFGFAALVIALPSLWRGGQRRTLLLLGCMPAFVTLTAFVFSGQIRYHYPAMPFLILLAGWSIARLLRRGVAQPFVS
ncbi:glycosyltransferase family 39 protein [soil metagenome]